MAASRGPAGSGLAGRLGQARQPGQRMTGTWPARLPGSVSAGEGHSERGAEGPGSRSRVKCGEVPPGAASGRDISPVSPRNDVPDRAPGVIEGHQRLISPFLTRDHEPGISYGRICSIYPVCFAVSGTAGALLTRDHAFGDCGRLLSGVSRLSHADHAIGPATVCDASFRGGGEGPPCRSVPEVMACARAWPAVPGSGW